MDTNKNNLSENIIQQILNDENLRNEILEKAAKDETMQEKLNNYCCIPAPITYYGIEQKLSCACGDCRYYEEEHDMGKTIPYCGRYDKFGNLGCNDSWKYTR